jgi:hypothetical protein
MQHGEITVENRPDGGAEFRIGLEVDPGADKPSAPVGADNPAGSDPAS